MEESIYKIIPEEIIPPKRAKKYKSHFPGTIEPSYSSFGNHSNVIQVKNLSGNYSLRNNRYTQESGIIGKSKTQQLSPINHRIMGTNKLQEWIEKGSFVRSIDEGHSHRTKLKPLVPKQSETVNLKLLSNRNFVATNKIDVMLQSPKQSDGEKNWLTKKDYGKIPLYLSQIQETLKQSYQEQCELNKMAEETENQKLQLLPEEELKSIREGLKQRYDEVNQQYQNLTHLKKFDTVGLKRRKEQFEKELVQLEKDMQKKNELQLFQIMNSFDNLKSKEEELLKINAQLDQQRLALKEDYMKYKNKDSKQNDFEDEDEYQGKNHFSDDDNDDREFNDVYKDYSDDNNYEINQHLSSDDEDKQQNNDQFIEQIIEQARITKSSQQNRNLQENEQIKYEDKKQEILELEMIIEEQKKIMRMQQLKSEALKQEVDNLISQNKVKENLIAEIEQKGKSIVDQTKKYNAQITQLNQRYEEFRVKLQESQQKFKNQEKENLGITKEIDNVKKEFRKIDSEANKKDITINRIVEQIQKLKLEQQKNKLSSNDKQNDFVQNIDQFKKDNLKIEQQITESLQALKKQLKLIDILKRQRIHIMAGRMFQFIEQDFARTTDMSNKVKY